MKTIQWGIIGCGNVTEVKSGPALQQAKNSELVAVMRRTGNLAEDYAKRHNVPKWYDDGHALINDPAVNAVYIATPPDTHLSYTIATAKAGKPVYVEKPMARNYAECQQMIEVCKEAGVPLFVAYYRRRLPRFLKVKAIIDSGVLGDIRFVTTMFRQPAPGNLDSEHLPWRYIPEIAGGGIFADMGSHMLDILDYLLGPIAQVAGSASNQWRKYPAEDIVTGSFLFESGIHGTGTWCFTSFDHKDHTEIIGDKGKVSYECFGETPIVLTTQKGIQEFSINNPKHIQQPLIQTIVDELTGTGKCPSTGTSGARTNWVMDQLLHNYYSQKEI